MTVDLIIVLAFFILILLLVRWGLNVGLTLFLASLFLIFTLKPTCFFDVLFSVLSSSSTWYLVLTSALIAFLAELYRLTNLIRDLGFGVARVLHSPRLAVVVAPAVIGLLPVAGGALMSAPIVEVLGGFLNFSDSLAVYANVWFRHTIFLVYPLSSLMITVSALSGVSIDGLVLLQFPMALFMVFVGCFFSFYGRGSTGFHSFSGGGGSLLASSFPLLISISSAVFLRFFLGDFGMTLGVFLGVLSIIFIGGVGFRGVLNVLFGGRVWDIAFTSFSVMFLQRAFGLTGASSVLSGFLVGCGVPLMVLEYIVPGVLSLVTGSPLTGVVLFLPILGGFGGFSVRDVSRIYISSYLFYVASPIHLCYVYTAQYFNCNLSRAYRYLIPSVVLSLLFAVFFYSII